MINWIKSTLKSPLTIWLDKLIKSKILEYKNNFLKLGYMSSAINCKFAEYNTIYNYVNLNKTQLGSFTYVSANTKISNAKIGKFCSIGQDCKIGMGKHPTKDFVSTHPIFFSTLKQAQISFVDKNYFDEFEEINIGNDVWIGSNVLIIDGINVGDGVIIAAGSVVSKNIPPYAIVGGIPAKIIRYRFKEDEIEKLLKFKWWDKDLKYLRNHFKKFHNIKELLNDIQ